MTSPHSFSQHLFVGVDTRQNTANLVPIARLQGRRYLAVQTPHAVKHGWGEGLQRALADRGVSCEPPLRLSQDDAGSVGGVYESVYGSLQEEARVVWLLGGGRKSELLGLWMAFEQRAQEGHPDLAVYSDPGKGELLLLSHDENGGLVEEVHAGGATFSVKEVLTCFGREIREATEFFCTPEREAEVEKIRSNRAYRRNWMLKGGRRHEAIKKAMKENVANEDVLTPAIQVLLGHERNLNLKDDSNRTHIATAIVDELAPGLPFYQDAIELLSAAMDGTSDDHLRFDDRRRAMARNLARKLAKLVRDRAVSPADERVTTPFGKDQNYAAYFEGVVQTMVAKHAGRPVLANVWVRQAAQVRDEAEHDALLVTRQATLVSLDAKTFDVASKDLDARLLQFDRAGGGFSRFIVVLPYFLEDLDLAPKKLRELPFLLDKLGQPFAVVAADDRDFVLDRDSKENPLTTTGDGIRCESLASLLQRLRL